MIVLSPLLLAIVCEKEIAAARASLQKGDPASALARLNQGRTHCASDVSTMVLKGQLEYLLGMDEAAAQTFRAAVDLAPGEIEPRYAYGRHLAQMQLHGQAILQFRQIVERHPAAYKAWDNLGVCLEALGREDEAMQAYVRAIGLVADKRPDYDWPYANLASLLINRGEPRRSFDLAVAAAERNPDSARNFYLAGKALTRLDQWEKSERWLRRAVELDPSYPEPRHLLGQVCRRLGRSGESAREFAEFEKLRAAQPTRPR